MPTIYICNVVGILVCIIACIIIIGRTLLIRKHNQRYKKFPLFFSIAVDIVIAFGIGLLLWIIVGVVLAYTTIIKI